MKKIKSVSNFNIAKSKADVNTFDDAETVIKKGQEDLKRMNKQAKDPEAVKGKLKKDGEYRIWFTRKTLIGPLGDLLPKEKFLVLVMELWRDKKTNTGYPKFEQIIEKTNIPDRTLTRLFNSLEKKGVYKIDRRKDKNNFYHYLRPLSSLKKN